MEKTFNETITSCNVNFSRVILEEASSLDLDLPAWKVFVYEGREDEAIESITELIKRRKERGYALFVWGGKEYPSR